MPNRRVKPAEAARKRASVTSPERSGRWRRLPEPPSPAPDRTGEPWTKEEDRLLRRNYTRNGARYTAALLGRTMSGINRRAETLGVPGSNKRWTAFEDKYLRRMYVTHTATRIAHTLKRTEQSVRARIHTLGLGERGPVKWMAVEIEYLRENYGEISLAGMALELGRSAEAVQIKAGKLGLTRPANSFVPTAAQLNYIVSNFGAIPFSVMARKFGIPAEKIRRIAVENGYHDRPQSRKWTDEDLQRLREMFGTMSREAVAAKLDRTVVAVADRARTLGLTRKVASSASRRSWTPEELALVRRHHGRMTYAEIGRLIDRSPHAVAARAAILGLVTLRVKRKEP